MVETVLKYCSDSSVSGRFEGRISERLEKYDMVIYEIKVRTMYCLQSITDFIFFAKICSKFRSSV